MASLTFNAAEHAPSQSFEVLPAGEYVAMISSSEVKATRDGSGSYISLRFDIVDGQFKGRCIFKMLNIWNQNPKAVEIANGELSSICHATNVMQLSDTSQLHNRPMLIKVAIRPAQGQYDASNDIKSFKPLNEAKAQPSATLPHPTTQTAPTPAKKPAPWEK